jgi:uncharacterized SAM-dependent methyltransferase
MLYFKNSDLAKKYVVSDRTVHNWIVEAEAGKLELVLHRVGGRTYVANTAANIRIIERLIEERRKYRNTRSVKEIAPRPEFYKLFTQAQIYDITTNLQLHHEIPREYNYFDDGAGNWDEYAKRLAAEDSPNTLNSTIGLLKKNQAYIDDLIGRYKRVNVVDIGVGNALPVRDLLSHLLERGVLGRYIALDISREMLNIAERNIKEWFDGQVHYEGLELDINHELFSNMLAESYIGDDAEETVNLVLFLGGTLCNLRKPDGVLRVIHDSMGWKDILVHTDKLDTEASRRYFDFNSKPGKSTLAPNHRFIFDLLNIDESFYEVEMGFDEAKRNRYIRVRLKVSLIINFEFEEGRRRLELNKGQTILLWRHWEMTPRGVADDFERNDFHMLHMSQTEDEEYILTISRVERQS